LRKSNAPKIDGDGSKKSNAKLMKNKCKFCNCKGYMKLNCESKNKIIKLKDPVVPKQRDKSKIDK